MKNVQKEPLFIILIFVILSLNSWSNTINNNNYIIGKQITFISKVLGEERSYLLYLPSNYNKTLKQYPVLYLLDGDSNFHHVSGIVDILSRYAYIPEMIVVAVLNVDRERDFLPTRTNNWPPVAAAEKFLNFLKTELIPHVEESLHTSPYRILCGHSFGGLFCIYSFIKDPNLFTAYIAASPSIEWDEQLLITMLKPFLKSNSFNKKYLYFTTSGDDKSAIPPTKEFAALLEKYSPKGLEWKFDFMAEDDHMSVVHPTIYDALRWLHKGWRLKESTIEKMTLEQVKNHYDQLSLGYGSTVQIPEGVLFNMGYSILDSGDPSGAIKVFIHCVKLYPEKAAGYFGLGDVYWEIGKFELAKKYYESACEKAEKDNDKLALPAARGMLQKVLQKMEEKDN